MRATLLLMLMFTGQACSQEVVLPAGTNIDSLVLVRWDSLYVARWDAYLEYCWNDSTMQIGFHWEWADMDMDLQKRIYDTTYTHAEPSHRMFTDWLRHGKERP